MGFNVVSEKCVTIGDGNMEGGDCGTLGDAVLGVMGELLGVVIDSNLFNYVTSSSSAFRTGSSADKDGVVDDGGL